MNHPIIPPPELVEQWMNQWRGTSYNPFHFYCHIANCAAQWGAGQELEGCIAVAHTTYGKGMADWLRSMRRRPQPPSVRKQAYDALDTYIYGEPDPKDKERTYNTIRKALEQLNDE